jgi:hypothetical protein
MCVFVLRPSFSFFLSLLLIPPRQDDKTAKDFNIGAGAVLHLVLALRGGAQQ